MPLVVNLPKWKHRRLGFDPWVGKILWRRAWQPTPVFLPGESHGQRSLVGYSSWCLKELDRTERLTLNTGIEERVFRQDTNGSKCAEVVYSFSRAAITKYHKLGSLKQQAKIYSLPDQEAESLKLRRGQGHAPSQAPGEESFLASSSFWWLLALFDLGL